MSATVGAYRSQLGAGNAGFPQLVRAEWTKFRTVRGWVIGSVIAMLVMVGLSVLAAAGSHASACAQINGGPPVCHAIPPLPVGPGGGAVTDQFSFVHQPLLGNGKISARMTSLQGTSPGGASAGNGQVPDNAAPSGHVLEPWSKAGLIIKDGTKQGSAYAAIMVTGSHGVRFQYNFTNDVAGMTGAVTAASPRWLRLTRTGDTVTGYDSANGTTWTRVGTAVLAGLPHTVQAGLFATSPAGSQLTQHIGGGSGNIFQTVATAAFDHVTLTGRVPSTWVSTAVGSGGPLSPPNPSSRPRVEQGGRRFVVSGSGDIAPAVAGQTSPGQPVERTLIGAFAALIAVSVLGTLFITVEYRRGLIRTTLTASPRRGRVLAAKAVVIACMMFVAGLVASTISFALATRIWRSNGNYLYPATTLTEVRLVVGTAALLAVAAVLALAVGTILRRSAAGIVVVIVAIVVPYILSVAAILPSGPADWLLRLTPAAGFAIQQSLVQYAQVAGVYTPVNGYFPLAPWAGFAVLCAYAGIALALAGYLLRRRDV